MLKPRKIRCTHREMRVDEAVSEINKSHYNLGLESIPCEKKVDGGGEAERVNANSSRQVDIKFAFILYSVIYDTDLSRAVDVRAHNCFACVRV